jgi:hypothetical protein
MKRDGVHNIFKPSDVTRYPFFYIEMFYAISTLMGVVIYTIHARGDFAVRVPDGASAAWQIAASEVGVLLLFSVALITTMIGFYGLFKGGFKWRSTHMFLQFMLRLYTTIGMLAVYGFWPTNWISSSLLALISGVIYLKLRKEQRDFVDGH